MALTFPRPFPGAVAQEYFEIDRPDHLTAVVGGAVSGVTDGWPRWAARWTLGRSMSRETSEAWRAMLTSLRGQQRTFFAGDSERPFPAAYPDGFGGMTRAAGGAFDGTATSWSINTDRDTLALNGLRAGFVLSLNDYLMFRWTTGGEQRRSLHRSIEAVTGNGSGVLTAAFEPAVPTFVPSGAVADFVKPECIMRLDVGQTRVGDRDRTGKISGTVVAVQDLRA